MKAGTPERWGGVCRGQRVRTWLPKKKERDDAQTALNTQLFFHLTVLLTLGPDNTIASALASLRQA